ncbi:hypothetical protein [Dyadobacter subterraneus]
MSKTMTGPLPKLTLTSEEIRDMMVRIFAKSPGTYNFINFVRQFSQVLIEKNFGFKAEPNTIYDGEIIFGDQAIVREIIWALIIERNLTVVGLVVRANGPFSQ